MPVQQGRASFLTILILASAPACQLLKPKATQSIPGTASVSLLATGDIMIHERVSQSAQNLGSTNDFYFGALIAKVRSHILRADIAFANLESPVAKRAHYGRKPFIFNSEPFVPQALQWAGFDILSVANNHSLDQGLRGFRETLEYLDSLNFNYVGGGLNRKLASDAKIITQAGLRVGFLGFTKVHGPTWRKILKDEHTWVNADNSDEEIVTAIQKTNAIADITVVSIHWGDEYAIKPSKAQKELAKKMHAAGADLILGHHPHVLQAIEWGEAASQNKGPPRKTLTAYSLGNFISNQSRNFGPTSTIEDEGRTRDGIFLNVELGKDGIQSASSTPLWTLNPVGKGRIQVISIDDYLKELSAKLESQRARIDVASAPVKKAIGALQNEIKLLKRRREIIMQSIGPNFERLSAE